jgi:hypothetical protein
MKSTVLDPGGQSETKFKMLDNNLPVMQKWNQNASHRIRITLPSLDR